MPAASKIVGAKSTNSTNAELTMSDFIFPGHEKY